MFQLQNQTSDLDMSFEAFTELYINDVKNRLKENTWLTKEHIIRTKITALLWQTENQRDFHQKRLSLGRMKCLLTVTRRKNRIHKPI